MSADRAFLLGAVVGVGLLATGSAGLAAGVRQANPGPVKWVALVCDSEAQTESSLAKVLDVLNTIDAKIKQSGDPKTVLANVKAFRKTTITSLGTAARDIAAFSSKIKVAGAPNTKNGSKLPAFVLDIVGRIRTFVESAKRSAHPLTPAADGLALSPPGRGRA